MKISLVGFWLAASICATEARADQLQTLWSFTGGADGGFPSARLLKASDGALYGTTETGGTNGFGTVFKITSNGAFTNLWSFTGGDDGERPGGGLVQVKDGGLCGVTQYGGSNGIGAIYKITTNGVMTQLWSFTAGDEGLYPKSDLAKTSDGALYGTASGGSNGFGVIYKFTTNGVMTQLWSFTGFADGQPPMGALVQASDGALYGTTRQGGGVNNAGAIYRITTNGAMTPLWSFTLGADGGKPEAGLVQANDGALYGTAFDAGSNTMGTIFKITTNGVLTPMWSFTGGADGRHPKSELVQASDGALYGASPEGGTNFNGTIFKVTTGGVFAPVWSFTTGTDGSRPLAGLVQASDGALYGTTSTGSTNGNGTVFRLVLDSLPPPSGYSAWATGITNGMTSFNQSATGDGYPNLLKYFTGSSPTTADQLARLTASLSNGFFDLRFNRNTSAVDVTAFAEGSYTVSNNAIWIGIATNINGSWGGATNVAEVSTGTPAVVTVRDPVPPATNRFLRLRVTMP